MNSASPTYSTLQELVVSDKIYKDKSVKMLSLILQMEHTKSYGSPGIFLITRPRGFGLSLVAKSVEKILERDRETICKIEDEGLLREIPQRHCIKLDFKKINGADTKEFTHSLLNNLQEQFWLNHIETHLDTYATPKFYLSKLIDTLFKRYKEQLVIIIDNYDIPIANAMLMENCEMTLECVCIYLDMLNVLKTAVSQVKWVMLTGHIKFALANEFSEGLPFVQDLSNEKSLETLFGLTLNEIEESYHTQIEKFAHDRNMSIEEYLKAVDKCYGNFAFSDSLIKVLCPACIAHVLNNNGLLLPYSATANYPIVKKLLSNEFVDLSYLYDKDGQDPLFSNSIDITVEKKQLASLLIQLGFATRARVLLNTDEGYTTWRYRFEMPNLDMQATFLMLKNELPEDYLTKELDYSTKNSAEGN